MQMQPDGIRVGVVGVGYWGSRHVRVLRSTTGVASVVGVDQRFSQIDNGQPQVDHGVAVYADLEEALPHVDAVIIATSQLDPATWPESSSGRQACTHRKTDGDHDRCGAVARRGGDRHGVVLMPGHTFEHNAAVHKLRDLVQGGHLGQLFYLIAHV